MVGFGLVQIIPKWLGRTNSVTLWNFELVKWLISIKLAIFSQKWQKKSHEMAQKNNSILFSQAFNIEIYLVHWNMFILYNWASTINCLFFLKIAIFAQKITQKQPKNKPKITCTSPKPNILYSPPVEVYRIYVWAKFALICFAIFQVITFSLNY